MLDNFHKNCTIIFVYSIEHVRYYIKALQLYKAAYKFEQHRNDINAFVNKCIDIVAFEEETLQVYYNNMK